tara:strand:+ start:1792 stop:2061 length:270 start_codon:yes stop_codon:yes gene_type:complete
METTYLMVSVDPVKHALKHLSYDKEDREENCEKYMWALELLTRVRKHHEHIGFCQFLKLAQEHKWQLMNNTAAIPTEVIYLLHYINDDN